MWKRTIASELLLLLKPKSSQLKMTPGEETLHIDYRHSSNVPTEAQLLLSKLII